MTTTKITVPISLELTPESQHLIRLLQSFEPLQKLVKDTSDKFACLFNSPPAHGEYWAGQGGYHICTLPALLGLPERHLIASKDEHASLAFGPNEKISGCSSHIDGPANTKALLAAGKHPAAQWASSYTADGHADFHLPSKLDMVMAYICAPQLFKKEGWYWTSTQHSRFGAFVQDFEYGGSDWYGKDLERRVRAFRWIHLTT